MFNALSRNTRQSFMVLATAAAIVFATGAAVRGAVVLRGPAARAAVAEALLPFVRQFRRIDSICCSTRLDVWSRPPAIIGGPPLHLTGRYRFWASGGCYRIDWQILRSNFSPIDHQIWTFNGGRYESTTGVPNTVIVLAHRRPIGFFGPSEANPLFAPIGFICGRRTRRQPGNWLDWWRVRHHPGSVANLAKDRVVRWFEYTPGGARFVFSFHSPFLRYPKKWHRKSKAPPSFRPGGYFRFMVVLRRRQGVYLVVRQCRDHAAPTAKGAVNAGVRYRYKKFSASGGAIFLPIEQLQYWRGAWRISLRCRRMRVNCPINPDRYTINFALAPGVEEHHRIVSISKLPPAPARTQHLGNAAAGGRKK